MRPDIMKSRKIEKAKRKSFARPLLCAFTGRLDHFQPIEQAMQPRHAHVVDPVHAIAHNLGCDGGFFRDWHGIDLLPPRRRKRLQQRSGPFVNRAPGNAAQPVVDTGILELDGRYQEGIKSFWRRVRPCGR